MPDFIQSGLITTLHDLTGGSGSPLESLVLESSRKAPIGLVLPVTADDMRAEPFAEIVEKLQRVEFVDQIVVVLGVAPSADDYRETCAKVAPLGRTASVLWTDGPRVTALYGQLIEAGLNVSRPGKGRSVWTAFGMLLSDPKLKAFALHDCDIRNYEPSILARLCLPMVHPSLDFEFCKAYYSRCTDRMYGRVVRLLVAPFLEALQIVTGGNRFLSYMQSFRYPLAGEFAVSANLVRSNRTPSDWGLEIGTLAEVYRNTSIKRVCQVELCETYEHKHQELSANDPTRGLMKMAHDILTTTFRTLASMGVGFVEEQFATLHATFLRTAQDMVRQYHADALVNGLEYDRHSEDEAVEHFASQILAAGRTIRDDLCGGQFIPTWTRVLTAFPDFPVRLRDATRHDAEEFL
ncbi:MAG: glycosyl transferase [Planctomycetaceae bacterium]